MHLGVHQDRLPGHARGGRHGGGLGFDRQVGCLVLQVDGAVGGSRQLPRSDANLCRQTVSGAIDRGLNCDRTQVGEMGDAGNQAVGGLIGLDRGLDRVRGDATADDVVARAVQAGCVEMDGARGECWQGGRTLERQRRRHPRDRRAKHRLADVKVTQIDLHWQSERPTARGFAPGFRQPAENQMVCHKPIDLGGSLDQSQRRPVEDQAVDRDIWPLGVRHLNLLGAQRVGKAPAEALNPDHAAGQARGLLLDEAAPGIDVGGERDQQDRQHGNRQQHQDYHRAPFQQSTSQNACPMPIYNSNESPPGSLFNGTATSSRIGPMGV